MLFLRFFSEFLLIFEIKTRKILIVEFYITPMYAAFLTKHILLNIDYFISPVRKKIYYIIYIFIKNIFTCFPNLKNIIKRYL